MRGLPFQASQHDIVAFFQDSSLHGCFGYLSISDVVIDQKLGRPTGYALVFLQNELDAQRAIINLNKKHIGSRYIDVLPVFLKQ